MLKATQRILSWLLILPPLAWLLYLLGKGPNGYDFYPLYFGAQELLLGHSPYGPATTAALVAEWNAPFAAAGVAYPLPLLMLLAPLTALPFPVAAFLWTTVGFGLGYLCVWCARQQNSLHNRPTWQGRVALLLPFTFWPFYQGVVLSQASLLWFGLAVLMVICIERRHVWPVAICIVLLLLKPQNGAIFALYGLYWLFRHHRGALTLALTTGTLLLGASLLLQPDWIVAWLTQVRSYSAIVEPVSLLPLGLVVIVVAWRLPMPWWAKIAVCQTVLFPITSLYSTLPLLLAWCAFAPALALVGTGLSWLWVLLALPKSFGMVWLFILLPWMLTALWSARPTQRTHAQSGLPMRWQDGAARPATTE